MPDTERGQLLAFNRPHNALLQGTIKSAKRQEEEDEEEEVEKEEGVV